MLGISDGQTLIFKLGLWGETPWQTIRWVRNAVYFTLKKRAQQPMSLSLSIFRKNNG